MQNKITGVVRTTKDKANWPHQPFEIFRRRHTVGLKKTSMKYRRAIGRIQNPEVVCGDAS